MEYFIGAEKNNNKKNVTAIFFGPFPRRRFASRLVTSFYFTFVSLHFRHEFD